MKPSLLFLTLRVFSITGGIEKMSRIAGKALSELCVEAGYDFTMFSAYDRDDDVDERYVSATAFSGFARRKGSFALKAVQKGRAASIVIISHVNLLSVGYFIKKLSPNTRLILLAHGIEVWHSFPAWKRRMLQHCDLVLPVSEFTRGKLWEIHGLAAEKLAVVNNCLDPFLPLPVESAKSKDLLQRYKLTADNKILFTLTRLSYKERYKGYDEVMMALKKLKKEAPQLRYLIAGKYDSEEKARLDRMIRQQGLEHSVILAGFVPDEELAAHFNLADVYVMPSRKEGFGIVFIEALYYGRPVIAGNADGSVDALAGGEFGALVNPDRPEEIKAALQKLIKSGETFLPSRAAVIHRFGYRVYKDMLKNVLNLTPAIDEVIEAARYRKLAAADKV